MSALKRHGINHLSPSSLATWRNTPAKWVMSYLHRIKDESDMPGAWRGSAVEAGLDVALYGGTNAQALAKAMEHFELNANGLADDRTQKERENIPLCLRSAIAAFNVAGAPSAPNARQLKIESWVDGVPCPIIGYVDYTWSDWLMDLKTTARRPSKASGDHVIQVAVYWKATGRTPKLLYAAPSGFFWASPSEEELQAAWRQVEISARSLCRFLDRAKDASDALSMLAPNLDDFRWSDDMRKKFMTLIAA